MTDSPARRDELIAALDDRISRCADGDAEAIRDPQTLAALAELAGLGDDLEIAYTRGMAHHYRVLTGSGQDGSRVDADQAVASFLTVYREAPDLVPEPVRGIVASLWMPDSQAPARWQQRAETLLADPRLSSEPGLIDDAILLLDLAADATTGPGLARCLTALMIANVRRFEWRGELQDLDTAISCAQECLSLTAPGDHQLAGRQSNLASALSTRFAHTGNAADLDQAIAAFQVAVAQAPGPEQPGYLSNLGGALMLQFTQTGDTVSLDDAIRCGRSAIAGTDERSRDLPTMLATLGIALRIRFQRGHEDADINAAVQMFRRAAARAPAGHPDHAAYLSGLGTALRVRFTAACLAADIDESVEQCRAAVQASVPDPGKQARYLSNLGAALSTRFRLRHDPADLADALDAEQQAEQLAHGLDPVRALVLANLGLAMRGLADRQSSGSADPGRPDDGSSTLAGAARAYSASAGITTAPAQVRAGSAYQAGLIQADLGNWPAAVREFRLAAEQLSVITDSKLLRDDQQYHLSGLAGLGPEAAAAALQSNAGPLEALALLEQSRGVLLARALATRTASTALRTGYPALAERLDELTRLLSEPANEMIGTGADAARRHRLQLERNHLVDNIRSLPGFGQFLTLPAADDLVPTAAGGPVVTVNVATHRCDALISSGDGVQHIPLPDLSYAAARDQANLLLSAVNANNWETSQQIRDVLAWMWDTIVEPILATLAPVAATAECQSPARLWWVPTGPLTVMPLHAAGYHDRPGRTAIDRVVSSYTPTVRSFLSARPAIRPGRARRQVIVAVPSTPGYRELPGAAVEADQLSRLPGERIVMVGADATREKVLAVLANSTDAHFACHATTADNPSDSHLALFDGPLPVREIAELDIKDADIAYLSACTTAFGGTALLDESIHITSAFQLAGFRHVIGTLWPVGDNAARSVADLVYTSLAAHSPAYALHQAVRQIRNMYPDNPLLWAGHVHVGS